MNEHTKLVIVDGRFNRSPFQVFLLLLCMLSGYRLLVFGEGSEIIRANMDRFYVSFWGAILLVGATAALVGAKWRGNLDTGLLIERVGLYAMGGMAIVYGILLLIFIGPNQATVAAITTAGFGGFCFAQVKYINKVINTYIRQLEKNGTTEQ